MESRVDITAETIDRIVELTKPQLSAIVDVHGVGATYADKPLYQVEAKAPALEPCVNVFTLTGFADLIHKSLEGHTVDTFKDTHLVHIEDYRTVTLKRKVSDEYGRRNTLIKAQPVPFDQFRFGQWMPQEEFTIALASLFADEADKAYVLSTASSLTNDASTNTEDDGFTQRVTLKAGMRLKEAVTLKPKVTLAPFRTFPEINQPQSAFVLRARCNEGSGPALMLVEADGGRWKVDAISAIQAVLMEYLPSLEIIA